MIDRRREPDSQPMPQVGLTELDPTLVLQHIALAQERGRYTGPVDAEAFLHRHHCLVTTPEGVRATIASTLMFTVEPEQYLAHSGVDVAQFRTAVPRSTALRFIEKIRGPLPQVITRVTQLLWDRSEHSFPLEGDRRVEMHAYPRVVLRELTVNALSHRDWTQVGTHVRIHLYPNAVEWISPGGLAHGVTIENLLDTQFSRNPTLVTLLYQAGYIEGIGLGMNTVFDALHDNQNPPPAMQNSDTSFAVRITSRAIGADVSVALSAAERKTAIRNLITQRGLVTMGDLEGVLQTTRRTIQRDLRELLDAGVIDSIGTTNDRRYRLRSTS